MLFFFKQKTTYEMRISDWSSDVCSSDLAGPRHAAVDGPQPRVRGAGRGGHPRAFDADQVQPPGGAVRADDGPRQRRAAPRGSRMSTPHADMSAASDARRNWTAPYTVASRAGGHIPRLWGHTLVPPASTLPLRSPLFG